MSSLPTDAFILKGGCDCSAIRYTISVPAISSRPVLPDKDIEGKEVRPPKIILDHCNKCRRVSGAIVQAWFICPQIWVAWSVAASDQPTESEAMTTYNTEEFLENKPGSTPVATYKSSPNVTRAFCGRCGTNLLYLYAARDKKSGIPMVDIVLGSLDTESLEVEGVRPDRHFFWGSGIGWVKKLITEGDSSLDGKPLPRHPDGSRLQVV